MAKSNLWLRRNAFPWAWTLIAVAVFFLECFIDARFRSPSLLSDFFESFDIHTLVRMGGLNRDLVHRGGTYRFFTATWIHGSGVHLLMNAVSIWVVCLMASLSLDETSRIYRAPSVSWAVFFVSAFGTSLVNYGFAAADAVSVGASGGVVGLAAFLITVGTLAGPGPRRWKTWAGAVMGFILFLLLPEGNAAYGHLDRLGHFGGMVAGVALGIGGSFAGGGEANKIRRVARIAAVVFGGLGLASAIKVGGMLAWR